MDNHGGLQPASLKALQGCQAPLPNNVLNLRNFASERPDTGRDIFKGYGNAVRTHEILLKLIRRMAEVQRFADGKRTIAGEDDNPYIPAGYTYLAQLAAHDLVQSLGPTASLRAKLGQENLRTRPLILDTIYGGGPAAEQAAYELEQDKRNSRCRFRLGGVERKDGVGTAATWQPLYRDIPRIRAEHVSDVQGPEHACKARNRGLPDLLIADPRNDSNVLLSQTEVLFKLIHNCVLEHLAEKLPGGSMEPLDQFRLFARARRAVVAAYRSVVKHDLLERLLAPEIYALYRAGDWQPIADPLTMSDDSRLPAEFAHGAFRLGHAMVRHAYKMNPRAPLFGIRDVIWTSSHDRPNSMPLNTDWMVQWSEFFQTDGSLPQHSRRISASYTPSLLSDSLFATESPDGGEPPDPMYGGLLYRDLVRAATSGMRTVDDLCSDITGRLPAGLRNGPRNLLHPDVRRKALDGWLRNGSTRFNDHEREDLFRNPPLPFFLLFEAAHEADGFHFGTLGSVIVGDVFLGALRRTKDLVETVVDPESGETADDLLNDIFKTHGPKMADLLTFVAQHHPKHPDVPLV